MRARHLQLFLALAEKARPELVGPHQADWLVRLDLERENLLAAHAWCMHVKGGGESALSLINGVKLYWASRGQFGLLYRLTVEALAHADAARKSVTSRGVAVSSMPAKRATSWGDTTRRSDSWRKVWQLRGRGWTRQTSRQRCRYLVWRRWGAAISRRLVDILWKRLRGPESSPISMKSPLRPMGLLSFIVS